MSEVTLEERGRALENQFYEKENQQKLTAMKEKLESQNTREELRKASGMSDDAITTAMPWAANSVMMR